MSTNTNMNNFNKPSYVIDRMRRTQIADQVVTLKYVLPNLRSCDFRGEARDLYTFIAKLHPFPQPLHKEAVDKVLEDRTLRDHVMKIYNNASLVAAQYRTLHAIKAEIRKVREAASEVDPDAPNTLGWRVWTWDQTRRVLVSPVFPVAWHDLELRVDHWDTSDALRGCGGIHARRMPRDWTIARWSGSDAPESPLPITGIVERFGKYVLGELGWRAEWVIIRKLLAPTKGIGDELSRAYPDVTVHVFDTIKYGDYHEHW